MASAGGGNAFERFFLAMIEAKQGDHEPALRWYDRAVEWFQETQPGDLELYQFQVEAADLLNLETPSQPEPQGRRRRTRSPDGRLRILGRKHIR